MRPASRAGRLFAKQQERMHKYTSESQAPPQPAPRRSTTSYGERSMPWQQQNGNGKKSKWGVPKHLQQNGLPTEDLYKGNALAPLPQPLPEWRAKTEANYKYGDAPLNPFSSAGFGKAVSGGWGERNSMYPFNIGTSKIGIPIATVTFDSRLYRAQPHRKQIANDAYTPQLFVSRDFNAKPQGWTRDYVEHYFQGRI